MSEASPLLLSYDGSENAKHAIVEAARITGGGRAVVVSVFQDSAAVPTLAWAGGASVPMMTEMIDALRESAEKIAAEGAGVASEAGFETSAVVVESTGPIWKALVDTAEQHDVRGIVIGSRGLGGVGEILLGSVSNGVLHHTHRPVIVVRGPAGKED
jgi:nucleotide-binding universal stress UspA family protein